MCKYCEEKFYVKVRQIKPNGEVEYIEMPINYCPMCGEKKE